MGWTGALREIRIMRFGEVHGRFLKGSLTCAEAADCSACRSVTSCGIAIATKPKAPRVFTTNGSAGPLFAGRLWTRRVIELYATRYFDFHARHFHEKLITQHGFKRSYTWTKRVLQEAGCVTKAKKRGAHRRKRERKPLPGMMLHQDGSSHRWVSHEEWDLIVTMDDATNEVYSMFFVAEEGTMSSFRGLFEVIDTYGLFGSLYADRGSHYWTTKKVAQGIDKQVPTQVKRALDQLGIELIPAYSPEARGRSERMFETLQGRLPQELRLADITTIEAANQYLRYVYLPAHNAAFQVEAGEAGSAFIPYVGRDLADILCVQEDRIVSGDNCVSYKTLSLQIPPDRHRHHYVKARVRVHQYPGGDLAIFHGPRRLARYTAAGDLIEECDDAQKAA